MPEAQPQNPSDTIGGSLRVQEMIDTLQKVCRGEFQSRVPVGQDNSELDHLARVINQTIDTFQTRSQAKLLEQKLFFENILNKFPVEVVIFNPDFRYLFINPKAVKDAEMRTWLLGKTDYDYCRHKGLDEAIALQRFELYLKVRKEKKALSIQQSTLSKEGKALHYLRILNPILDDKGRVEMFIGYGIDITELKNKENELQDKNEELELTNKILDQYVYRTSHDLRAPLTSLLGLINLTDTETSSTGQQYLRLMEKTVTKLDSFISSIVENSQNTRQEILNESVDLPKTVKNVLNSLQFLDGYKKIHFEEVYDPASVPLFSDARRVGMILNNLLSNAIKYQNFLQPKQWVKIECSVKAERAEITLSDNGIGIPEASLDKVFDMFYRATHHAFGSGMGLYIVRETLKKLQGEISLSSEEGKGTVIKLSFANQKPVV